MLTTVFNESQIVLFGAPSVGEPSDVQDLERFWPRPYEDIPYENYDVMILLDKPRPVAYDRSRQSFGRNAYEGLEGIKTNASISGHLLRRVFQATIPYWGPNMQLKLPYKSTCIKALQIMCYYFNRYDRPNVRTCCSNVLVGSIVKFVDEDINTVMCIYDWTIKLVPMSSVVITRSPAPSVAVVVEAPVRQQVGPVFGLQGGVKEQSSRRIENDQDYRANPVDLDLVVMAKTADSVTGPNAISGERSDIAKQAYAAMIKVPFTDLTDIEIARIGRELRSVVCMTKTNTFSCDHPYLRAMRHIVRQQTIEHFKLMDIKKKVLIIGATVFEVQLFAKKENYHFLVYGGDNKDMLRNASRFSDEVDCDYTSAKTALGPLAEGRVHTSYVSCSVMISFDASIYHWAEDDYAHAFLSTGAGVMYGYGFLPKELHPEFRWFVDPAYNLTFQGFLDTQVKVTFARSEVGYVHDLTKWQTLLRSPIINSHLYKWSGSCQLIERGQMSIFTITPCKTPNVPTVRGLSLPTLADGYTVLDMTKLFDKDRRCFTRKRLDRFFVPKVEWDEMFTMMMSYAEGETLDFAKVSTLYRRASVGYKLLGSELQRKFSTPANYAMAVVLALMKAVQAARMLAGHVIKMSVNTKVERFWEPFFHAGTNFFIGPIYRWWNEYLVDDVVMPVCTSIVQTDEPLFGVHMSHKATVKITKPPKCWFCASAMAWPQEIVCTHTGDKEHTFTRSEHEAKQEKRKIYDALLADGVSNRKDKTFSTWKDSIKVADMTHTAYVLECAGGPGSGKSTIIRNIADNLRKLHGKSMVQVWLPVSRVMDDYVTSDDRYLPKTQHKVLENVHTSVVAVDEAGLYPKETFLNGIFNMRPEYVLLFHDPGQNVVAPEIGESMMVLFPGERTYDHFLVYDFRNRWMVVELLRILAPDTYNLLRFPMFSVSDKACATCNNRPARKNRTGQIIELGTACLCPAFSFCHSKPSQISRAPTLVISDVERTKFQGITSLECQGMTYDNVYFPVTSDSTRAFEGGAPALVVNLSRARQMTYINVDEASNKQITKLAYLGLSVSGISLKMRLCINPIPVNSSGNRDGPMPLPSHSGEAYTPQIVSSLNSCGASSEYYTSLSPTLDDGHQSEVVQRFSKDGRAKLIYADMRSRSKARYLIYIGAAPGTHLSVLPYDLIIAIDPREIPGAARHSTVEMLVATFNYGGKGKILHYVGWYNPDSYTRISAMLGCHDLIVDIRSQREVSQYFDDVVDSKDAIIWADQLSYGTMVNSNVAWASFKWHPIELTVDLKFKPSAIEAGRIAFNTHGVTVGSIRAGEWKAIFTSFEFLPYQKSGGIEMRAIYQPGQPVQSVNLNHMRLAALHWSVVELNARFIGDCGCRYHVATLMDEGLERPLRGPVEVMLPSPGDGVGKSVLDTLQTITRRQDLKPEGTDVATAEKYGLGLIDLDGHWLTTWRAHYCETWLKGSVVVLGPVIHNLAVKAVTVAEKERPQPTLGVVEVAVVQKPKPIKKPLPPLPVLVRPSAAVKGITYPNMRKSNIFSDIVITIKDYVGLMALKVYNAIKNDPSVIIITIVGGIATIVSPLVGTILSVIMVGVKVVYDMWLPQTFYMGPGRSIKVERPSIFAGLAEVPYHPAADNLFQSWWFYMHESPAVARFVKLASHFSADYKALVDKQDIDLPCKYCTVPMSTCLCHSVRDKSFFCRGGFKCLNLPTDPCPSCLEVDKQRLMNFKQRELDIAVESAAVNREIPDIHVDVEVEEDDEEDEDINVKDYDVVEEDENDEFGFPIMWGDETLNQHWFAVHKKDCPENCEKFHGKTFTKPCYALAGGMAYMITPIREYQGNCWFAAYECGFASGYSDRVCLDNCLVKSGDDWTLHGKVEPNEALVYDEDLEHVYIAMVLPADAEKVPKKKDPKGKKPMKRRVKGVKVSVTVAADVSRTRVKLTEHVLDLVVPGAVKGDCMYPHWFVHPYSPLNIADLRLGEFHHVGDKYPSFISTERGHAEPVTYAQFVMSYAAFASTKRLAKEMMFRCYFGKTPMLWNAMSRKLLSSVKHIRGFATSAFRWASQLGVSMFGYYVKDAKNVDQVVSEMMLYPAGAILYHRTLFDPCTQEAPLNHMYNTLIDDTIAKQGIWINPNIYETKTARGHMRLNAVVQTSMDTGYGNVITRSRPQVVNTAIFRVGDKSSKRMPMDMEGILYADKVINNFILYAVNPNATLDYNVFAEVYDKLVGDANDRCYALRYDGADVEFKPDWHTIHFSLKAAIKPMNYTKQSSPIGPGQGIANCNLLVTTKLIYICRLMVKIFWQRMNKNSTIAIITDDGLSAEEFVNILQPYLSQAKLCGAAQIILDAVKMDKEQKEFDEYVVKHVLHRVTGCPLEILDFAFDHIHDAKLVNQDITMQYAKQNSSGNPLTKIINEILMLVYGLWLIEFSLPMVITVKGDDEKMDPVRGELNPDRVLELTNYTKVGIFVCAPGANEFCGFLVYDEKFVPNFWRYAIRLSAKVFHSYEQFKEYQISLRDLVLFSRRVGKATCVAGLCYYLAPWDCGNLDYIEAEAIYDFVVAWAYASKSQYERYIPTRSWVPITHTVDGALSVN